MSLPEASDNEGRTREALTEQNRLIDEQASRVKSLQEKIAGYQYVLANPGWTPGNGFMINHLTSVKTVTEGLAQATEQLAVEQSRLAQMQEKAQSHSGCACRAGRPSCGVNSSAGGRAE